MKYDKRLDKKQPLYVIDEDDIEVIFPRPKRKYIAHRVLPITCKDCKFKKAYVKNLERKRQERKEKIEENIKRAKGIWSKVMEYKVDMFYCSVPVILFALIFVLGPLGLFVIGAYLITRRGPDTYEKKAI